MFIDSMKDNGFTSWQRKEVEIIMDVDYANDIALLANTPAKAKTLQYSLERAAGWHRPPCQRRQDRIPVL